MNKTYLFIGLFSVALGLILIIQINWILKTAQIKEDLFNEKAKIVLSRTTDDIKANEEACLKIGACISGSDSSAATNLGQEEINFIDSIFSYYMAYYNFKIDYSFVVAKPFRTQTDITKFDKNIYYNSIKPSNNSGNIEIKLLFPEKKKYIIAELGPMFLTSILLILGVFFLFWRNTLSLIRQKTISEQTSNFLNNMAHEFKTPLTNINLATKMINKQVDSKTNPKIKNYADIILSENKKLGQQVEQALGMSALEKGEIHLQKTSIDIHQIIENAIQSFSLQINQNQGKSTLQLEAKKSTILADKTLITNALYNLIDNAIKYSNEQVAISIKTISNKQNLIITVSDKGIGIEKQYQNKVFNNYFRVPTGDVHNVKGFGLGLAYVKKIIELHQGAITLQSKQGMGSTFTIILPNE